MNLLLSWASENQQGILTAKFYEYLAARNQILLIINGSKDEEFESIFKELQAGGIIYNKSNFQKETEDFILNKYQNWFHQNKLTSKIQKEKLINFRWDTQMKLFIEALEKEF